jgi:hypothetical protein
MQNCAEDEFMIQTFSMSFALDLPKKNILVIWPLVLSKNPNFVWQAKKPWFVKLLGCKYSPPAKYGFKVRKVAMKVALPSLIWVESQVNSYFVPKFMKGFFYKSSQLHV